MSANAIAGGPRLAPVVCYDASTGTFAAWCDELAVATSAPTEEEARLALVNAMRAAANYALRNAISLGPALAGQVPAAELVAQKSDSELAALIHVAPELRPS